MKYRRLFAALLALCMAAALLAGCGSSSSQKQYTAAVEAPAAAPNGLYAAGGYYEYEAAEEDAYAETSAAKSDNGSTSALPANRKFIITVNLEAETNDLDSMLASLNAKIDSLSGYIENQNIYNGSSYSSRRYRNASMTVRIPVKQLDAFTEEIGTISNIISSNRNTEDVTLNYVDTESRITALKTEQARLLELLEKAENMEDLLVIEERLTEVRYSLEQYSSRLRVLDNQIDYATIYLDISEVKEYTPVAEKTRWERIRDGFAESIGDLWDGILDFFADIIIDLPYIIVFGLLIWIAVVLFRFLYKKHQAKKMKKLAARYQAMQARKQAEENKPNE